MARQIALDTNQNPPACGKRVPARAMSPTRVESTRVDSTRVEPAEERPIIIEAVMPELDGGAFAAKGAVGEKVDVEADIFKEGHDVLRAEVLYRLAGAAEWRSTEMKALPNDRWRATWTPDKNAYYEFTIEAWFDPLGTWLANFEKKAEAGVAERADVDEGLALWRDCAKKNGRGAADAERVSARLERAFPKQTELVAIARDGAVRGLARELVCKVRPARYRTLELFADRERGVTGAWYELFPRSQGRDAKKSGTFKDCIARLDDIRAMGFNVVYLPPIHPIGKTNRKGPNNSLKAGAGAPGSPWAIGSAEGGHKSIDPALGTFEDFAAFREAAENRGIEIALDLAYQCSPDHPYVREHPEWFRHLPDGSIRYAENPPKKYEDIFPFDFYCEKSAELRNELKSIVEFWIGKGVRIFRVDNPHTKPLAFWRWLIREIRVKDPGVVFLSEAFTRPKVMKYLAKAGFTQSYTYFTWRNTKEELREYVAELEDVRHYFRGNFFVNTPDILTEILQRGGRPAFKSRLVLAATLSPIYGIYSGYELVENKAKAAGSEEYIDSEKYEIKPRDWNAPGNIKDFISRVNRARETSPAVRRRARFAFLPTNSEDMLAYALWTDDLTDIIVCIVNLDPFSARDDVVTLPLAEWGIEPWQTYQMKDLLTEEKYYWKGPANYVRLDPQAEPAHVLRLKK